MTRDHDSLVALLMVVGTILLAYTFASAVVHDLTGVGLPGGDILFQFVQDTACDIASQRPGSCPKP